MKTLKKLKKELLPINRKYVTAFNNVDWRHSGKILKRYYISTEATTAQLRKLNVPYFKAVYDFENTYSNFYRAITGNIIRKKDEQKVDDYLNEVYYKNNGGKNDLQYQSA